MELRILTLTQAKTFMLTKQGLLNAKRFSGKSGICEFVRQAGCIQFDPIDIAGKNAELVLQARIKDFNKSMLSDLLYHDRVLIDYFDKNLSIFAIEDWPKYQRIRSFFQAEVRSQSNIRTVRDLIREAIKAKGFVCSKDFAFNKKVSWYWGDSGLARVALEALYYYGELIIHHKNHALKYYALAEDYIPKHLFTAEDPNVSTMEYLKWKVLQRIGAVGLLWNRHSDAFLFIQDLKTPVRNQVIDELEQEHKIIVIAIEGIKDKFFCLAEDGDLLDKALKAEKPFERVEFIAPLDNLLWDRKLIKSIFNFDYTWEIYTVESKRKFGYYVIPILYRNDFIGRIELINHRKDHQLEVKKIWYEAGWKKTKMFIRTFNQALKRFAKFNDCISIVGAEKADINFEITS